MNRQGGVIPPIKSDKYPKRFIVFDTEAYRSPPLNGVEYQTLRLGVARYVELGQDFTAEVNEYYNFTTPLALVDFITYHTRKDKSLYVYAHNLRYDLQLSGLYTGLVSEGWISRLFVVESPPTFIKLHKGRASITLVDTFNYWQVSVKAMGEQLGLSKLDMPTSDINDAGWFNYCKRDVDVLTGYLLSFMRFLRDNDLCGLGLTLASQAFRSYRYRFMQSKIILHNRQDALSLERDGYFGGRCEAYFIGNPKQPEYYKLDVNSMYPYVMKANTYPNELVSYSENVPLAVLEKRLNDYYCIGDCDLSTLTPAYAYSNGVKLLFPTGRFRAVLYHNDLLKALDRGDIQTLHRLAIYKHSDLFTLYVDYFYSLKSGADSKGGLITKHQAKIFLNSLYGKFGQRQVISKIVPYTEAIRYARLTGYSDSLHQNIEVNYLGNSIEVRYKQGEAFYSFPAIAGAVTAYARAYLWELITKAGKDNVYYVDTDSLIVNKAGYLNLADMLSTNLLGKLKVEGVSDYLQINSAKDYTFGGEVKVKGVPKTALKLSDNLWQYEQFRGAKTWMNEGMSEGVTVTTRIKQRRSDYDKGVVLPSGKVIPLTFDLRG